MKQPATTRQALHPIQVAARRSGLSPHVIRAWERRYDAVSPIRSGTNRRLYTNDDVERLLLLNRVTRAGRRIGQVAGLSLVELRELAEEDRDATARVGDALPDPVGAAPSGAHVGACLEAVERLDAVGLDAALRRAAVDLKPMELTEQVLMPFLRVIGDRWHEGSLRIAHEHMATAIVRSFVGHLSNRQAEGNEDGPELIVASPAGQVHEFGSILVSIAASTEGWRVTHLGADLPADEIASTALIRRARAVALSIVYPADDPRLAGELRALRNRLGKNVAIIVGGRSAGAYKDVLQEIDAVEIADAGALQEELRRLRLGPPNLYAL